MPVTKAPYPRVLDERVLTPKQETELKAYRNRLSGMDLHRRALKRLRKIQRIQPAYAKAKYAGKDLSIFAARPALALCATPSGAAVLLREDRHRPSTKQCITTKGKRIPSVQYLANQKPPNYLDRVFSI